MTAATSIPQHLVEVLRIDDAAVRGLSLEPLWWCVADQLDLTGVDGVISGGESGPDATEAPLPIE